MSDPFLFYVVQPGDTLTAIVRNSYPSLGAQGEVAMIQAIAGNNGLRSANHIQAGQLLMLTSAPSSVSASVQVSFQEISRQWNSQFPKDRERALSLMQIDSPLDFLSGANGGLKSANKQAAKLLENYLSEYGGFARGEISHSDFYNKVRPSCVRDFDQIFKKDLRSLAFQNGEKSTSKFFRVRPGAKNILATGDLSDVGRVSKTFRNVFRVNSLLKVGGVAMTGLQLVKACNEISNADNQVAKNQIFSKSIGNLVGGEVALYFAVGLVSGPLGWGTILFVATAVTLGAYGTGEVVSYIYDSYGNKRDIVGTLGVDRVCH